MRGADRGTWGASWANGKTLAFNPSKMEPPEGSEQERGVKCSQIPLAAGEEQDEM